jgi:hypothetical protein
VKTTADVTGGKPIAVLLQSISGVSAINPLVAFYVIHGGKREVLFFYFVPDTTRDQSQSQYSLFSLGMYIYTYERQDITQIALKRLPGGVEGRKKKVCQI